MIKDLNLNGELVWALVLIAFYVVAFVIIYRKRRFRKTVVADSADLLEGTEADRLEAEKKLRAMPLDIREKLLDTFELYKRFPTSRGYSREYLEDLSRSLREAGVANEFLLQEAGPVGFADSIIEPRGIFELYVEKGKSAETERIVSSFEKF